MMIQSDAVEIKRSIGKGRGVFARRPIKKGEVIETVPILIIPASSVAKGLDDESLGKYYYYWNTKELAIALGYGSIYNHAHKPNADYEHGYGKTITYRALRPIEAGEEITINYKWDAKEFEALGFKP